MNKPTITIVVDSTAFDAAKAECLAIFATLSEAATQVLREQINAALDSGVIKIAGEADKSATRACHRQVPIRVVVEGLVEFVREAARALQGNVHGDPLQSGIVSCGDSDSTAGGDSHPDSRVPA
ncbi:hypothetical protein KTF20_08395 [Burkholderia multivorans]|uniref:hypothetical protein n=1 Tax=Burkholderia multivorans TaxID=87883 RepID=UPI0011B20185|nr:hypothetical protein [Burkholderia multivorans]MBU9635450.1 hypothetical protein [Burkholderia multivorans]